LDLYPRWLKNLSWNNAALNPETFPVRRRSIPRRSFASRSQHAKQRQLYTS